MRKSVEMSNNEKKSIEASIIISKDGPYIVSGDVPLSEKKMVPKGKGYIYEHVRDFPHEETYALCRCGKSKNPPFCDGSHLECGFDGTETASKADYEERAEVLEGSDLDLLDDNRCAYARFCHRNSGNVWELTVNSDDSLLRDEAIKAASECPAGRLVARDKDGNKIEPEFKPSIEILQDIGMDVSGPLYVKGGIPIKSSKGFTYEVRNRIALCRCGKSRNKPFCDASHVTYKYKDGLDEKK